MGEENQEGPFTVWQMFNAPTMVLFNNLEHASDGLDRLLTSILKLSGDFSEVLVPRPGNSKYPDEYYEAFNTWLIGRLFYVWSVKELEKIHLSSKNAQLKVLNILCINGASFFHSIHYEYFKIIRELVDYYKNHENLNKEYKMELKYFSPKSVKIPNIELDLRPIYVSVQNLQTCTCLIDWTLKLLCKTIPLSSSPVQMRASECVLLFEDILYMLEHFNVKVKLICLSFFCYLIDDYNKVSVTKFHKIYPEVVLEFCQLVESLVTVIPVLYWKSEINKEFLNLFSEDLHRFLALSHNIECKNILEAIISIVIDSNNSKIFSKKVKEKSLLLTSKFHVEKEKLKLNNKDDSEIDLLKDTYCTAVVNELVNKTELKDSWYYQQVLEIIFKSIDSFKELCADTKFDMFLQIHHLKKAKSALEILLNIFGSTKFQAMKLLDLKILPDDDAINLLGYLKVSTNWCQRVGDNFDLWEVVGDVVTNIMILSRTERVCDAGLTILLSFLGPTQSLKNLNWRNETKLMLIKMILNGNTVMKRKLSSGNKDMLVNFVESLNQSKNNEIVKILISFCPVFLLNEIYSESKLIGQILMPALLTKNQEIQTALGCCLPDIVCMSLGRCAITLNSKRGHNILDKDIYKISVICSKCHNSGKDKETEEDFFKVLENEEILLRKINKYNNIPSSSMIVSQKKLFAKFLNAKVYLDIIDCGFLEMITRLSNHSLFSAEIAEPIFNETYSRHVLKIVNPFLNNVLADADLEIAQKDAIFTIVVNSLVNATKVSLENNDYSQQTSVMDCVKEFGLCKTEKVILPSTKLLIYFIMHPQGSLGPKASIYLRNICEAHTFTPNQVYHRYKKDYCRLFVDCSLYNGEEFAVSLLKVVRAFGFVGYRDFISKDVHHFLPYLIPYSVTIREVPSIIEEIASLVQCSVADFLIERFPHVYTYIYLFEDEGVAKKCFNLIERMTKMTVLNLIRRHFRVILTEFLLQYCCNPEKVLNACRYLACHDPDVSTPNGSMTMTTSQVADFLQPKFLGVLAYFDHKLVNAKVALSVKRKALQSFPDIMNLMGVKYLTPLRFKVLATLRSAMTLVKEFPKIVAAAWSAFIHNIDTMSLGPLLSNLAVSLLHQFEYAPNDINKIFHYLVLNNENLLSSHISNLFFLEDTKISDRVKMVINRHLKRTQPESFPDRIRWYLQYLNQDIPVIKSYAFLHLAKILKNDRTEIHKAIFGGKTIDPVIVELIDRLLVGCKDNNPEVSLASGSCLGQLGAIEAAHLPRQYVQPDRSPFAFSISEDCYAATALMELTRAFQYEKDTMNMDCYALTIQEILKIYNISPNGNKKEVWDSFPEHMHQILFPLLSSRYTLAYPSQSKKAHPLFGSAYATTFLEWAHNWAGQLIQLVESESIRELLRTVHPSMRRDVRTLFLFLPYVLLHAIMSKKNAQYIQEEMLAVIGLENFENDNTSRPDRTKYKLLRHIRMTPSVSSVQAEEGNQSKCSKMVYTLLDFLNRWLLEWCHSKQHPLQNDNYKTISSFLQKFDMLAIARGNFMCGEFERSLQYLELYMEGNKNQMQEQLPFLAEIYALLDEPDSVAGILNIKRSEPSLKELILAQVVAGRLQDAALCYERLAQEGPLDRHSLQGMIDCYLGLDQPFTAYRLLSEHECSDETMMELAAEPLWRLGRFEQLDDLVKKNVPASHENWGLLMGKILLAYRAQEHDVFQTACKDGMARLLSQMDGETKGESALRSGYQSVLGLHIVSEAEHAEEMLRKFKSHPDGNDESVTIINQLLDEWRRRLSVVQFDVRTVEPLLRLRRILLQQAQELLQPSHPYTADKLKSCIGDLWLQSAKQARKASIFQQSYMYILNAEEYKPAELFIEKAKMYWARGQQEQAFTTLRRGLDDGYPELSGLTQEQRKTCAKAKLLIAKYNDETTNVDVDVNIGYYKEAVEVCKQWEKSLVCLGAYYEKVSTGESTNSTTWSRRVYALNSYGKALQFGHKYLYQSMPRMLSIWLDVEVTAADTNIRTVLAQMTDIIKTYSERLPLYLYLTAFSQIVSRICHPVKEVYNQLKAIIVKLINAYPQHTLWMMMSVIKSSYQQRIKRCQDVFADPRLKEPHMLKLVCDFTQLAEKLIELCNKPIVGSASTTQVSTLVRTLPRLLADSNFSHIMMPFQEFCKIVLPSKAARQERIDFNIPAEPPVYISGIEERIQILPSLQKPRKVTLKGSDGKSYIIMLKPRDDLRKDYRLMEFNGVVNRFLQDAPETRRRRLYIRTYSVLPLNEECGLIEWVPNLVGLRPILMHIYKQKGIHTSNRELKEMMCANSDPVEKKRRIYEQQLIPRHPPVFQEWFRRVFSDPYGWYQARSAYIRTTAVMSMVGYILGLGDRHGENISFDSTNGDTVHVDFNCLFNKGEAFEWPERVPFRLTHNMVAAMGPLGHEGMYRKCCDSVMRALRSQTLALMSVVGPFVYDPLVAWGRVRPGDLGERTNEHALQHLHHIRQRLNGMVKTKNKQLSLSLSPEGQVEHLIVEATSVHNLCQMYIGWGPFL